MQKLALVNRKNKKISMTFDNIQENSNFMKLMNNSNSKILVNNEKNSMLMTTYKSSNCIIGNKVRKNVPKYLPKLHSVFSPCSLSKIDLNPPIALFIGTNSPKEQNNFPKRLFTLNKTFYEPLLAPKKSEINIEEQYKWKKLYQILSTSKEIDLHLYMNYLAKLPELKQYLDLYLLHKKVAPNAECIFLIFYFIKKWK